jgi:hypothetical protein
MLESSNDASDIGRTVPSPHPLEIDGAHLKPLSEEKIAGGGVAVQQHLSVLPHPWAVSPKVT